MFAIRSLPRRAKPSRFTRSYSDAFVRRLDLGKDNECACFIVIFDLYRRHRRCSRGGAPLTSILAIASSTAMRDAAAVQRKSTRQVPGRRLRKKKNGARTYEPGGGVSAGDSVVPAGDSDVPAGDSDVAAGDCITAAGFLVSAGPLAAPTGGVVGDGVAAGSFVSVFCSHAARSAAPASMEMYFFIVLIRSGTLL